MKRNVLKAAVVIGILTTALVGCRKDQVSLNPAQNDVTVSDIQALAQQSETEGNNLEVVYNESTGEIAVVNEGLADDYLICSDDNGADLQAVGSSAGSSNTVVSRALIQCLRSLHLDSTQIIQVRKAMHEYADCKASAIKRARAIHHQLVLKYKDLAAEQAKLLKDGKITRAEFHARIQRIRHAFASELRSLQLNEKLNKALKDCHMKFLRELNSILTDRQWKAFVACHKR